MIKNIFHKRLLAVLFFVLIVVGCAYVIVLRQRDINVLPTAQEQQLYTNNQYGFTFSLPTSWANYSIVDSFWEGFVSGPSGDEVIERGPIISIRHPQWTTQIPRQDIPVMIFTIRQWNDLQRDKFHIGAAPIGPSELGRNTNYVFALPARYNYAFPVGYEEVEQILKEGALQTF